MSRHVIHLLLYLALGVLGAWLLMGYILPIGLPFLLGIGLALAAEPATKWLCSRFGFPRCGATALSVSAVFLLVITVLSFLLALLVRQMQHLTGILPTLAQTVNQGMALLQQGLSDLAQRLPEPVKTPVTALTENLFSGGSALLEQMAMQIPKLATGLLGGVSKGMLGLITGIVSAYMISNRLPVLQGWWQQHQRTEWQQRWLPALRSLRKALGGWLLAEVKLAGLAFAGMAVGFLLLRMENSLLWAALITLVDAFPILGVGTVLVPWALVCLLQDDFVRGVGLLAIYGVVWLSRSILEPKLIGRGLGLDPLATLIAIYAGWKLWGIPGMLLAPVLTLAGSQIVKQMKQ